MKYHYHVSACFEDSEGTCIMSFALLDNAFPAGVAHAIIDFNGMVVRRAAHDSTVSRKTLEDFNKWARAQACLVVDCIHEHYKEWQWM